jgi:hypothetical protein
MQHTCDISWWLSVLGAVHIAMVVISTIFCFALSTGVTVGWLGGAVKWLIVWEVMVL